MTDWLLLVILLTGKSSVKVDAISVTRFPTQQACEAEGAKNKKESRKRATFTCFEVARIKK